MTALFGSSTGDGTRNIVEFKAGKMFRRGKMVHPDKRKGLVYMMKDDQFYKFCWKDRTTGVVEEELLIMPDESEYLKVPQCKTGRVFVLKFKSSKKMLFFWMQEPSEDKDDELCKKVNNVCSGQYSEARGAGAGTAGGSGAGGGANSSALPTDLPGLLQSGGAGGQLGDLFRGMDQGQLMELFGQLNSQSLSDLTTESSQTTPLAPDNESTGSRVSANDSGLFGHGGSGSRQQSQTGGGTTGSGTGSGTREQPVQLEDLQRFLRESGGAGGGGESRARGPGGVDLSDAIKSEVIDELVKDEDNQVRLSGFLPDEKVTSGDTGESKDAAGKAPLDSKAKSDKGDLPASPDTSTSDKSTAAAFHSEVERLSSTIHSPQFKQALSQFSVALQTGQVGALVSQFGLSRPAVEAANNGDMEAFAKALEKMEQEAANAAAAAATKSPKEGETTAAAGGSAEGAGRGSGGEAAKDKKDEDADDPMKGGGGGH